MVLTARDWEPPRFWIQAGRHDPGIVMARFDYAYDRSAAEGRANRSTTCTARGAASAERRRRA